MTPGPDISADDSRFDLPEFPQRYRVEASDQSAVPAGVSAYGLGNFVGNEPHPLHDGLHLNVDKKIPRERFEHFIQCGNLRTLKFRGEPRANIQSPYLILGVMVDWPGSGGRTS